MYHSSKILLLLLLFLLLLSHRCLNRHKLIFWTAYDKMWNGTCSSCLFVWFDSLCRSQQFFSYVGTGLPGLNQYWARINESWSRTQCSNAGEARIRNPSVLSQALYHWATALLWNGSGWYVFIGAILASTTDISPVVHLHAIGNIHARVCAKSTVLYPNSTQGPNPTNRHELTNIWIHGLKRILSSRRS